MSDRIAGVFALGLALGLLAFSYWCLKVGKIRVKGRDEWVIRAKQPGLFRFGIICYFIIGFTVLCGALFTLYRSIKG